MSSFRIRVERNLGKLPHFLLYAVLECLVIILILVDGIVSFACKEIARLYELRIPCLLCTRIDHLLIYQDSHFYFNDSVCDAHKMGISSLSYCNVHRKLSDVRSMCKECLTKTDTLSKEKRKILRCNCCEDLSKTKSSTKFDRSLSMSGRNEECGNLYSTDSRHLEDTGDAPTVDSHGKNDSKAPTMQLLPDSDNTLMALYTELDEERSASAIAANNAMAMITRLQEEKASVQMEASQYQRMMEEQAEYDQEAMQVMKEILFKREEDIRALESELDSYRKKSGHAEMIGSETCEIDDVDYQDMKSDRGLSSFSEKSDSGSSEFEHMYDQSMEDKGSLDGTSFDFEKERSYLLGLLRNLQENISSDPDEKPCSPEAVVVENEVEERAAIGNVNKGILTREVSLIRERLRVIEADSGFLKHAAMTLQRGDEGAKLLTEIAQLLRKQRHPTDESPSEDYQLSS